MSNRSDSEATDLGAIKIHRNSIASIAAIAAGEIDGVKSIGKSLRSTFGELFGRKDYSAIRVELDKLGEVSIEVPLVVKYNYNVPDVATKVQENVRNSLEKMTDIIIKDISINVQVIEKG